MHLNQYLVVYEKNIMKRIFDILFSVIGLLIFAVPMTIVCLIIKIKENHPLIYRQIRLGRNKKPFKLYKIQTMVDEQVTPIGKYIRECGLDEVPQFFNVLKGDMSIVGPRALTCEDIYRMKWNDDYHKIRWSVRPGITGFAQLYAKHLSKASYFLDCKYIEESNMLIDFILLCITFLINIFGKNRVLKVLFNRIIID